MIRFCRPCPRLVPARRVAGPCCHWDLPNAQEVKVTGLGQEMLGACGLEMSGFNHIFGVFSPLFLPSKFYQSWFFSFFSPSSPSHGRMFPRVFAAAKRESGAAPGQESVNPAQRAGGGLLLPTPRGRGRVGIRRSEPRGRAICVPAAPRAPSSPGGAASSRRGRGSGAAAGTPEPPGHGDTWRGGAALPCRLSSGDRGQGKDVFPKPCRDCRARRPAQSRTLF